MVNIKTNVYINVYKIVSFIFFRTWVSIGLITYRIQDILGFVSGMYRFNTIKFFSALHPNLSDFKGLHNC